MSSGTAEFERWVATTLDYECCISAEGITRHGGTLSRESCLAVTENSVWVRQWAREEAPFELDLTGWTVPAIQQLRPLADKRGVHAARHDEASEVKCVSAGSRQDSFELAVRLQTMLASRHGLETNCAIELWFRRTRIREMRGSKTMTELDRSARLIRASCFCADPPMYASCEVTSDMGESASRLARDLGREAPPAGRPRGQLLFSDTAWGSVCAFVRGAFCEGAIESNEPLGYGSLGEQVLGHDVSIIRRSSSLGDVDDEGLLMEDVPLVDCGILCAYILPLQRSYQLSLPTAGEGEIGQDGRLQLRSKGLSLSLTDQGLSYAIRHARSSTSSPSALSTKTFPCRRSLSAGRAPSGLAAEAHSTFSACSRTCVRLAIMHGHLPVALGSLRQTSAPSDWKPMESLRGFGQANHGC